MRVLSRFLYVFPALLFVLPANAAVNAPLTVQEALYSGSVAGVNRTAEPVTVGVPLPDNATSGASDVNQLTVSGASVGQFRVLGRWPSGRIKWVLVDTQASLNAGQTNTSIALTDGGAGNFGGSNLATDNGSTITVDTGAAKFTIKKANFNAIDQVVIAGKTVLASGASKGLVVSGPAPGQTTCPPCTTEYSSANDASSTAVIEENGPAKAVIKATGSHIDGSGNVYMRFTARIYFYKGKSSVKFTSILRNADYGTSNTFATAYKGFQGYELRIAPNISGTLNYTVANDTATPTAGTMSGTDSVYLYQGQSQFMKGANWCGYGCIAYTPDIGYKIAKNTTMLASGDDTKAVQGWADISDSSGAGVEIGVYQLSAYWPKSLEFNAGGTDVRIGIWARENSKPYYQSWPQYSIHDLYLNFHAAAVSSPASEFLKFQHYLVARASRDQYNNSGVFPYPLIDPTEESSFYSDTFASSKPSTTQFAFNYFQDLGVTDTYNFPITATRYWSWGQGGAGNQAEYRWANLMRFLQRGQTGRLLDASHFYRMIEEQSFPRSDGFSWNSKSTELDATAGTPAATSANASLAFRDWAIGSASYGGNDCSQHTHVYGIADMYFVTGDETMREAVMDGILDRYTYTANNGLGNAGCIWSSRSIGVYLMNTARLSQFLAATGDSTDAATVLANGTNVYNAGVKPSLCRAGYPTTGCSTAASLGVSRETGAPWGPSGTDSWCGDSQNHPVNSPFQASILLQGMWEFRQVKGPGWSDYGSSFDLMSGISNWALKEMFLDDGTGSWQTSGFRYYEPVDQAAGTCDTRYFPTGISGLATVWFPFYIQHQYSGTVSDWKPLFQMTLAKNAAATLYDDFGIFAIAAVIDKIKRPSPTQLVDVPLNVTNNGGGSYTLSWTAPAGAVSYRVKTGAKQIVNWIGFNEQTYTFAGNPATTMNWFAATDVPNAPAPGTAGQAQQMTVTGLPATGQNFALKAQVGAGQAPASNPPTVSVTSPANSATVSGTVTITASASDGAGLSGVQFTLDGNNLGSLQTGSTFSQSWNTTTVANGAHTIGAIATNTAGLTAVSNVSVTVSNAAASGPAISAVAASGMTSSGVTITWTTDKASDSQVSYGTSTSYGTQSTLASSLVTTHSVTLSSLSASTTYHYKVQSRDAQGNLSSSADFTFATGAAADQPAGSSALPLQTWTKVTPGGSYSGLDVVGWEKLSYAPALHGSTMLANYNEMNSEPNRALMMYDFKQNRWNVLENGDLFHNENMPEAGHPDGRFAYDPTRNVFMFEGTGSASMQAENLNHMYWFDPIGQSGRDVFGSPNGYVPQNGSAEYDPTHDKWVQIGSDQGNQEGTWVYDPAKNTWQNFTNNCDGGCNGLFDYLQWPSVTWNSDDKKIYMFGGATGYASTQTGYNDVYTFDASAYRWKKLNPAPDPSNGLPPGRFICGFVYDSLNKVFIVYGGVGSYPNAGYNDTWVLDMNANAGAGQWRKLNISGPPGNPPIWPFNRMAYDVENNAVVMVLTVPGGAFAPETWLFRYAGAGPDPGSSSAAYTPTAGGINSLSSGWAQEPFLTANGQNLYAAWHETATNAFSHIFSKQWTGSAWTGIPSTNIDTENSNNVESFAASIAVSGGKPWISYYHYGGGALLHAVTVKYWDGSKWQATSAVNGGEIGRVGTSTASQGASQIVDVNGTPYIAFLERQTGRPNNIRLYVKSFDGTNWNLVGGGSLNRTPEGNPPWVEATSVSMASDGARPYVAWTEYTTTDIHHQSVPQIYVSRWNGSQWAAVGGSLNMSATNGWAQDASIVIMGGQPYVAWIERTTTNPGTTIADGPARLYVKTTADGTNWTLVGSGSLNRDITTGWAYHPSLATDGSNLYVGWVEQKALGQRAQAYVSKYSSGAWNALGTSLNADPVAGSSQRVSLAVLGGAPVAAWGEVNFGSMRQVFVKQWNGSSWGALGSTATPTGSPCDLNGDGVTNSADVQLAISQALGSTSCSTADLQHAGQCNVIGVQRVITASLGGSCVVGP
jgi:hypothetical protein